jgi:cellulose synthase/poly-beta-1,6-N-acetylglucosamine synthase-like glycosyltransferase
MIIAARNEEQDLPAKLENTLALDYPPALLEIIVASDCSTDRTDRIAEEFAGRGVTLVRQQHRSGKTSVQNAAVEYSRGEIILFSDATSNYRPDVLRKLVRSFADPTVGCVSGRLVYLNPSESRVGSGARSYWGYEVFLKTHESRVCSLIGASGCLYAVRRSAYIPLYPEACSDFIIATKMVEQGLRAVYEPEAVCYEETNQQSRKEMKMRVRVIAQTLADLWRHRPMMNPFRAGFYAIQLLSHKILRYCVPFFLIAVFAASAVLAATSRVYLAFALIQVACYLTALVGWLLERAGVRNRLLALPHYFAVANIASLIAFYKFFQREKYATWEPVRERSQPSAAKG